MSTRTRARWTIVLSVLLILTGLLWARSYVPDDLYVRPYRGRLLLIFAGPLRSRQMAPGNAPQVYRATTGEALGEARAEATKNGGTHWDILGFEIIGTNMNSGYFILGMPFWAIGLPLALLTAWCLFTLRRERLRMRTGSCLKCGYDLRASTGVCPECGEPIPTPGSIASGDDPTRAAFDIPRPSP
jgi:hypothetical protein